MPQKVISYKEFKSYKKKIKKKKSINAKKQFFFNKHKIRTILFTFLIIFPSILLIFTDIDEVSMQLLNGTKVSGKVVYAEKTYINQTPKYKYKIISSKGILTTLEVSYTTNPTPYSLDESLTVIYENSNSYYVYSSNELIRIFFTTPFIIFLIMLLLSTFTFKSINKKRRVYH